MSTKSQAIIKDIGAILEWHVSEGPTDYMEILEALEALRYEITERMLPGQPYFFHPKIKKRGH